MTIRQGDDNARPDSISASGLRPSQSTSPASSSSRRPSVSSEPTAITLQEMAEQVFALLPWHVGYFTMNATRLNPWEILVNARVHLADQIMEPGDVDAWFELGEIQDQLLEESA